MPKLAHVAFWHLAYMRFDLTTCLGLGNNGQALATALDPKLLSARYFSRTHTMRLKSVLPGKMMLGAGADSMKSLSPSIL